MIYLDTSGLIALSNKKDRNYLIAKNYFLSIFNKENFIIGKHVLIEYLDGVAKRVSKEKAIFELENILNSKIMRIEFET